MVDEPDGRHRQLAARSCLPPPAADGRLDQRLQFTAPVTLGSGLPLVAPPAHLRRTLRDVHDEGRDWLSA